MGRQEVPRRQPDNKQVEGDPAISCVCFKLLGVCIICVIGLRNEAWKCLEILPALSTRWQFEFVLCFQLNSLILYISFALIWRREEHEFASPCYKNEYCRILLCSRSLIFVRFKAVAQNSSSFSASISSSYAARNFCKCLAALVL